MDHARHEVALADVAHEPDGGGAGAGRGQGEGGAQQAAEGEQGGGGGRGHHGHYWGGLIFLLIIFKSMFLDRFLGWQRYRNS